MAKKSILLLISLLILITIPIAFAEDVNDTEVISIDDSQTADGIYANDIYDSDVLAAGQSIYFNASAEKDGDGSKERPYKYLTSQRIGSGNTLYLANGVYDLARSLSISTTTFIGEDAQKTIINQNGYRMTISSSLTLKDLTLLKSFVRNNAGTVTATNVIFDSCSAPFIDDYDGSFGGAIACLADADYYQYYYPTLYLDNCTFINNTAVHGGAVYIEMGTATITDCKFYDNHADEFGGAIAALADSNVKIDGSIFKGNYAQNNAGGAIYVTESILNMDNCTIENCTATLGGAVCDLNSSSTFVYLNAISNIARYDGGAIYKMYGSISVSRSEFSYNRANNGGAILIDDSTSFTLRYNKFIRNAALCAGAVYSVLNSKTNFLENEYVGNTALIENDLYTTNSYSLKIGNGEYNLIQGNYSFDGVLPSRYNLADYGYVSPIKDQQTSGNCWAFSSIAALESCILKTTNVTYDLSEENLKNLIEIFSDYGWTMQTNEGGYDEMAIGYLTSWLGPVNETSDVFSDYSLISPVINSIFHIQNILYLGRESYTDNDAIKQAIMTYGAVSTGIYYSAYYLSSKNAYYYPSSGYANHAVTIVGWDDNYSRNNFLTSPRGDGAWIVKNSWGTEWGDNGYFYVSYYDAVLACVGDPHFSYTFIFNDTLKLDKNYQYDIQGITDYFITGKDTIWYKNVFNATDNELLAAFSTYFNTTTDWEAYVYVNDELVLTQNGSAIDGYFTIYLDHLIPLAKGDTFSIALKISADEYASFPVSEKLRHARVLYYPGVSFFSYDGEKWYDLYNYKYEGYDHTYDSQVACIKAFTFFDEISTSITLENVTAFVQTPTDIIANVVDTYGNVVSRGNVSFIIDNATYVVNVTNGVAQLTYSFNDAGSHNITAIYQYESLFESSNTTATVDVVKGDVNLTISIDDVLTYDNIVANITLVSLNGNGVNGTVVVTISGKEYVVNVTDGAYSLVLTEYYDEGDYEAIASFSNSDLFNNATASDNFTVFIREIYMNVTADVVDVRNILINVTLSDAISGTLQALLNGESYDINYADGKGQLLISDLDYDNYTVDVIFEKLGYTSNTYNKTLELKPIKTSMITDDVIMYYNDGSNFTIQLIDENSNAMANQNIVILINDVENNLTTDENGTASFALTMDSGNYTFDVVYNGTIIYTPANATNSVQIIPTIIGEDVIKYYKNDTQYYVSLIDFNGTAIANTNVTFNINGVDYNRTSDENGVTKFSINLEPGNYSISAVNPVTGETITNNITVLSRLLANDLVKYQRNESQYYIKVLDKQGNPLEERTVKLNINGVFYYRVTDSEGVARLNINLNPGEYVITAEYDGCKLSNNITVLSRLVAEDLVKYYKNDSQYFIKLLDAEGNPLAERSIKFNINGVFYYRETDSEGVAKMNINLNPDEYVITAEYDGFMLSNNITVLSTIESSDLEMNYQDGSKFTVCILDGQGVPFENQNVIFNINGVFYEKNTDKDGIARLAINLMSGEYIITSTYNGLSESNTIIIH